MNGKLLKIKQWVEILRDIGLIIGVPTIIVIGIGLYERQIDVLKAENELLKKSQYDKAWALIDSQKKIFENERELLILRISKSESREQSKNEEVKKLKTRLREVNKILKNPEVIVASYLLKTLLKGASIKNDDNNAPKEIESSVQ